jgi:membrane protein
VCSLNQIDIKKLNDNHFSFLFLILEFCAFCFFASLFVFENIYIRFIIAVAMCCLLFLISLNSIMWFVIALFFSVVPLWVVLIGFAKVSKIDYCVFSIVFIVQIIYWLVLSLLADNKVSKIGNEIVFKILGIIALSLAIIKIYQQNDTIKEIMDLEFVQQIIENSFVYTLMIMINITLVPSSIARIFIDIRESFRINKEMDKPKFIGERNTIKLILGCFSCKKIN